MRPLLINSEDRRGGAARAAYRLHLALRSADVDCRMLVQVKHGDDPTVSGPDGPLHNMTVPFRPALDVLPILAYRQRKKGATFYPGWLPDRIKPRVDAFAPDLVHLHWITGGTLNVRTLRKLGCPIVWTLHDMWAFTGGCHYDDDCGRYRSGCGRCPVLGSQRESDLSAFGWRRKNKAYRDLPLTIVTPSKWLGELARNSPLLGNFPVNVIPNAIDIEMYRPTDKLTARKMLRLPPDRKIILFGALRATSETRKGYHLLQPALRMLGNTATGRDALTVILGASQPAEPPDFGMESVFLGTLSDDVSLGLAYSAADVFVAPSTQENLSNAVMESLACGTPVVAFNIGGMPDMIEHRANGYLADAFDTSDLANGLEWVIADDERHAELSARARRKVGDTFAAPKVAREHLALYEEVLRNVTIDA
jgi:glycosyltransferase involved in cell wall biosynthesis